MPKALPVDHEKVKMVALQIGVREAARRFGLSEDMVRQWSKREKWFAQKAQVEEIVNGYVSDTVGEKSPAVTKSASDILQEYQGESKLQMAHGLQKTAKAWNEKDDDYRLKTTQALANLASTHAKLFPEGQSRQSLVNVNILNQGFSEVSVE